MIKAAPKQMINYLQIITQGQENKPSTQKKTHQQRHPDSRCCAKKNIKREKHLDKDDSAALLGALERLGV